MILASSATGTNRFRLKKIVGKEMYPSPSCLAPYILPNSALKFEVELEDVIPFVEETTPATTDEAAAATTQAANSALPVKK